jgi:hypothetical protein
MVVVEKTTEALTAVNSSVAGGRGRRFDQIVPQPLMVPLAVIVRDVFGHCSTQVPLAERYESIETFAANREHEPLRERVQIRAPRRKSDKELLARFGTA